MSDIFNEIEQDMRRERAELLWKKYGPVVIGVALLIVVGVAGWRGWQWYNERQAQDASARYEAALALAEAGQFDQASAALGEIAAEGPSGYAVLSRFAAASASARADAAKGIAAFEALSSDTAIDATLRDLARLRAGLLESGTVDYAALKTRLEPLTQADNPWRHLARETLATAALAAGNPGEAKAWTDAAFADPSPSPDSLLRAEQIRQVAQEPAALPAPVAPAPPVESTNPPPAPAPAPAEAAPAPAPVSQQP